MEKLAQKNQSFKKENFENIIKEKILKYEFLFLFSSKFSLHALIMGGRTYKFIFSQALIHQTSHHISCNMVEYSLPNKYPSVKNGRLDKSSDQCYREYSKGVRTWHLRDERTNSQVNKVGRRPPQNYGYVLSRFITFASSTGPSHIPTIFISKSSTSCLNCQQCFIGEFTSPTRNPQGSLQMPLQLLW